MGANSPSETTPLTAKPMLAEKSEPEVQKSCHDIIFALVFVVAVFFTLASAATYGDDVLMAKNGNPNATVSSAASDDGFGVDDLAGFLAANGDKYGDALEIMAIIAAGTFVLTIVWTGLMLVCGSMLIWIVVIAGAVFACVGGYFSSHFLYQRDVSYYWVPDLIATSLSAIFLLYIFCIRTRIQFATENLQSACKAVLSYPVILIIAVVFTILQVAWAIVWALGTYGAVNHDTYGPNDEEYSNSKKIAILFGMILIFFWVSFVCKNVITVTTAGTVSSWWHHSSSDRRSLTTTRALCRALTYSFGSICFGSLIVSIIQTIRVALETLEKIFENRGNCVAACIVGCIESIIGCVQRMIEYFTKYAYTYVGIYGYNFYESGKRSYHLFASKGWSAIANDSLIDSVLLFGCLVIGFIGATAGWGAVTYGSSEWTDEIKNPEIVMGTSGFLVGFTVSHVLMNVVSGAVATVFVLFAEDPHALEQTHPEEHRDLHEAWKSIYPKEYTSGMQADAVEPSNSV